MKVRLHTLIVLAAGLAGIALSSCTSTSDEPERSVPESSVIDEAELLTAAEDYDGAVILLEDHLALQPGDVEAWRELGRSLERLVDLGGGSWLALQDAGDAYDGALELEADDLTTLQEAASVRFRLGEYERANELAAHAFLTAGDAPLPAGLPALRIRARMGAFQVAQHAEDDAWMEDLRATLEVTRAVRSSRRGSPDDGELAAIAAGFLDWLGLPDVAVERMEVELGLHPDEVALHKQLIDIHVREGTDERLPPLYAAWKAGTGSATVLWYAGYVFRLAGDLAQRERDFERARGAYAECIEALTAAAALDTSYADSAGAIANQAEVSIIWCHLEEQRFAEAEASLLALLLSAPERREEQDGLGRSLMNACAAMGQRWVDLSQFERAARVSEAVVAVSPEDGEWWNNLGFLLREYGTQMDQGAFPDVANPKERAREIFRRSWKAYLIAAELKPEDARVINDGALIQVYHLQEELELAEEILWRSIKIGQAQLAAMGPYADDAERFPVAQAVGDAYQNLGYMYYHYLDKQQESREYWVASMATDSGDRSMFQVYVDHIDGKGDPVPLRIDNFVVEPEDSLPPRTDIPWESSFVEARGIANDENRALVIYNRGEALGLAIPFLDTFARGERFAERTRPAVVLVADAQRHNFVDRKRDGTKLACAKWGAVTCGDHMSAFEEFSTWYRETNGADPGESEEGIWMQGVEETEPTPLDSFGLFQEDGELLPAAAEAAVVETDLDALSPAELVALHRRASRDALEAALYEGTPSTDEAGAVARALAADDDPRSREMLAVMAWQPRRIPALAALAAWPAGLELGALIFVSRWSADDEVRGAANEVILRELPEFSRVLQARAIVP